MWGGLGGDGGGDVGERGRDEGRGVVVWGLQRWGTVRINLSITMVLNILLDRVRV